MTEAKKERSLVIVKPDGVQRSLIGEVIKRYEKVGLKLVGLKMIIPTEDMAYNHYYQVGGDAWIESVGEKARASYEKKGLESPYQTNKENGEAVLASLVKYLTSGPVVAMVWQGNQAVPLIRKIAGGTEPLTSDVGTIRGDYTLDTYSLADTDKRAIRNIIHASGTVEEAIKEINLWFKPEELLNYRLIAEEILYDVNLDGIKE
ncbi:MAG: nucleoside-diphosphate kinase [bacterium]